MTKILNFTPHPIHIVDAAGTVLKTFTQSGLVRLKTSTVQVDDIMGIPITSTVFGEPEGLPAVTFGDSLVDGETGQRVSDGVVQVYYIVSQLVKSALPGRPDLLVPAEVVRDRDGNIVGCKSLGL